VRPDAGATLDPDQRRTVADGLPLHDSVAERESVSKFGIDQSHPATVSPEHSATAPNAESLVEGRVRTAHRREQSSAMSFEILVR
jgi:hypothetical protein